MSINREFWLDSFQENNLPNWPCPRCGEGVLRPVDDSFRFWESGDSYEKGKNHLIELGFYDSNDKSMLGMELAEYRYSVLLRCNNSNCREHVSSCGFGYVAENYNSIKKETEEYNVFEPLFFHPQVNLFSIPKSCPRNVSKEIQSSFKLFFTDPPAAASYARKAVDEILTNKRVKRYVRSKGKQIKISLHDRIVAFQKNKPEVARKLIAVKWLGNEGSHTDNMTKNDVLDAYEILEFILDDLYVGYRKLVDKKVEKIIKGKKPLHPST
jgi:Domain of unknown function (DUF4145)